MSLPMRSAKVPGFLPIHSGAAPEMQADILGAQFLLEQAAGEVQRLVGRIARYEQTDLLGLGIVEPFGDGLERIVPACRLEFSLPAQHGLGDARALVVERVEAAYFAEKPAIDR